MNEQIQRIETKVQQLVKLYLQAQKENQQLQKENYKLKEQLAAKGHLENQLQQKVDALKMNRGSMDEGTKKELEKRINIYLKDIDKCLAMLHS
jgi:cell division septum initiation protein DivIVA